MKELLQFLLGIVLTIIGVIIFLQNVVVSSFTLFYRILIVLIVVAFIAFIVKPNMLTGLSLIGLCVAFFVCLVISLNVSMRYMSGLELALILGTIGVGVGFIIKGLLGVNKADKEGKKQGKNREDRGQLRNEKLYG